MKYGNFKKAFASRQGLRDDRAPNLESTSSSLSQLRLLQPESTGEAAHSSQMNLAAIRDNSERAALAIPSSTAPRSIKSQGDARDSRYEPLGLHVLHDPGESRAIDIIFVHGLGASCRFAWSHNKNLSLFWPKEWLPTEPGFEDARILTFGYNALFKHRGHDVFNISDFAKYLLFQLKFANSLEGDSLQMGKVPLIFVCHSMGGLVVKKAYILGLHDPDYQDIIEAVRSLVFLATPHRGSTLADTLNKVLSATFRSPKQYVSDLQRGSARIADINDQFKLYQDRVQLVSFFETQPTTIGLSKKAIVVERESAVLDYPNEISNPLKADHSAICKYSSRSNPNYVSVKNVLKFLVERFSQPMDEADSGEQNDLQYAMSRLGVFPAPFDKLESLLESYVMGSCDWALSDASISPFLMNEEPRPTILHLTGRPGSGKSMLASFLISHLCEVDCSVQFWFFRYDDFPKRTIRNCLLSLVFQMISSSTRCSDQFWNLGPQIEALERLDARKIWEKIIIPLLESCEEYLEDPFYWVIDALDEADSAEILLRLLPSLKGVQFPLRIVLFTRSQTLVSPMHRLCASFSPEDLLQTALSVPSESLALYIDDHLLSTPWDLDIKLDVTKRLLEKSSGSYLWLSIVLKELETCATKEQVDSVLTESPEELLEVYRRLEQTVTIGQKSSDMELTMSILTWIMCANRQLHETELKEALLKSHGKFLGLKHTASRLCGDFISIDGSGNFALAHETVKHFLLHSATSLRVDDREAHFRIFWDCFSVLMDPRFPIRLKSQRCTGFLSYCCLSWSSHLHHINIPMHGCEILTELAAFFMGTRCLAWIDAVATSGQLLVLISTATTLKAFFNETIKDIPDWTLTQQAAKLYVILSWSKDLVQIVGKFGSHLLQHPSSIYTLVPLFCPQSTIIARHLKPQSLLTSSVSGFQQDHWEESVAKLWLGHEQRPRAVVSSPSLLGIVTSEKAANVYDATTFQQIRSFPHAEIIVAASFNIEGTRMVTCGVKSVKIWDTSTGKEEYCFLNPHRIRPMTVSFSADAAEIIVICTDGTLKRHGLLASNDWVDVPWQEFDEPSIGRGGPMPVSVAFSQDGSLVALSHRTRPVTAWSTRTGNRVGRIQGLSRGRGASRADNSDYAVRLAWCSGTIDHVVGIFTDGTIFKWHPMDPHSDVMSESIHATEIACSPDGRLILTGNQVGCIMILDLDKFNVIYRLESSVRPHYLSFSSDGRQILDLRDSFCNIWAPDVLAHAALEENSTDDKKLLPDSTSYFASKTTTTILEPVTALCADSVSTAFAFGTSAGKVKLGSAGTDSLIEIKACTMKISCLAFSKGGSLLAVGSKANKVVVKSTAPPTEGNKHATVFENKCQSPVQQVLFSDNGLQLLIYCRESLEIWSLETGTCALEQPGPDDLGRLMLHPTAKDTFLFLSSIAIETISTIGDSKRLSWGKSGICDTSARSKESSTSTKTTSDQSREGLWVSKLIPSRWGSFALLKFSTPRDGYVGLMGGSQACEFVLLDTCFVTSTTASTEDREIRVKELPKRVASLLNIPIGIVPDDGEIRRGTHDPTYTPPTQSFLKEPCRLAFIDHEYWVRTWSLDDPEGHCTRHFFLPQDWIHLESLELAQMTHDGRFLCPKSGEVAIVTGGHKLVGIDETQ